jgi:hypothetical protein
MDKEIADRQNADDRAVEAYEFWSLMGEVMEEWNIAASVDTIAELPAPSPDSITVTTEFGVSEEPSNITTISAAGPPPSYSLADLANDAPEHVEELLPAEHNLVAHPLLPTDTTPPPITLHVSMAVHTEDLADDEADELDFDDDDDMDAESALIDAFIDDGPLTPTASNVMTT